MGKFLAEVSEHYPVLLVAEVLVLLTLGVLGYLLRRLVMPFAEQYLSWYREKRLKSLSASIERLDLMLNDNDYRNRVLIFRSCYFIFFGIMGITCEGMGLVIAFLASLSSERDFAAIVLSQLFLWSGIVTLIFALGLNFSVSRVYFAEKYRNKIANHVAQLRQRESVAASDTEKIA